MSEVSRLVAEARMLAGQIDASEEDRPDVALLLMRVHVAAARATLAEQVALQEAVALLERSVQGAIDRLGERLRLQGAARSALAAYGALRPHSGSQFVRSRA